MAEIEIEIGANTKDALDDLKKFSDRATKQLSDAVKNLSQDVSKENQRAFKEAAAIAKKAQQSLATVERQAQQEIRSSVRATAEQIKNNARLSREKAKASADEIRSKAKEIEATTKLQKAERLAANEAKKAADEQTAAARKIAEQNERAARRVKDAFRNAFSSIRDSITPLRAAIAGVAVFLAGRELVQGIQAVTAAAATQEDAVNQLNTALRLAGDFSDGASQDLQTFASELQKTSVVGDETTLQMLALAKSFGATNEQSKDLVRAAANLSAATGISLESAVRNLGKTFGGLTGELGEVVPALKGLSKEALESGAAIEFINQRFGGAAQAQVQTFSGAVAQLSNTFGDLQEELGRVITRNPAVIKALSGISDLFSSSQKFIRENSKQLGEFVKQVTLGLVRAAAAADKAFRVLFRGIADAGGFSGKIENVFQSIATAIFDVSDGILRVQRGFLVLRAAADNPITFFSRSIEELAELTGSNSSLAKLAKQIIEVDKARADLEKGKAISLGIIPPGKDAVKSALDLLADEIAKAPPIEVGFAPAGDTSNIGAAKGQGKAAGEAAGASIAGFLDFGPLINGLLAVPKAFMEAGEFIADNIGAAFAGFQSLLSGDFIKQFSESIASFLTAPVAFVDALDNINGIFEKAGTSILKALDKLPSILTKFLNRFPQFFQRAIDAFIKAAPKIVSAIADALPVLITELGKGLTKLFKNLPQILQPLIDALPEIINSLFDALPDVISALFEAIPQIFASIVDVIPDIVEGIAERADEIVLALVSGIVSAAPEIVASLINSLLLEGGLERIVGALIRAIPRVAVALVQGFVQGIANTNLPFRFDPDKLNDIVNSVLTGLTDGIKELGGLAIDTSALSDVFDGFFEKIDGLFTWVVDNFFSLFNNIPGVGGGGGSGGFLGSIGLAEGGKIPVGFSGDTFPARLTSGEVVIPRDTVSDLERFLGNQQGGGNTDALLRELISAVREGRMEIGIREDGLSEYILDANRRNERLTA